MTFSLPCSDPIHRLFALIGTDNLNCEITDHGVPAPLAVAGLALDLPDHMHGDVMRLMAQAGWCNEHASAEPTLALAVLVQQLSDGDQR
jgi:hypothetical protein